MKLVKADNFGGITELKGVPVISSRKVGEIFGKQHDNVLRDIRNLDCSVGFFALNYEEKTYESKRAKKPEFFMTKDGFTFLAMGYRGKKAAQFKESYINRFNQMEQFIKSLLTARMDFPEFTDAIRLMHEEPKHYHFINEVNMINRIVLGMTAKQFRDAHGIENTGSIRPYLAPEQIKAIESLQKADIGLLVAVQNFNLRKSMLEQYYGAKNRQRMAIAP